ncbi:MAG: hypothetical protein R3281_15805 [Balneolaceae bacterium]|nr:hypothetical protein [Balneolaceae bacterium]
MVRLDGNKPGMPFASSGNPNRDLAVVLSVDLLRSELNGSGLARS